MNIKGDAFDESLHLHTEEDCELSINEEKSLDVLENTLDDQCLTRNNMRERRLGKYENVLPDGKLKGVKRVN